MEMFNRILCGFILLGLLINSGFGNPLESDQDWDSEQDYEYPDEDENSSKHIESNNVNIANAYFEVSEMEKVVNAGDTVTMECDVKNLTDINIIFWYNGSSVLFQKKSRVVADSRTNLTNFKHSLKIENVQATDENVYICKVVPENVELRIKLIVKTGPVARILLWDRDVSDSSLTFGQGEKILLNCMATGFPEPIIKWFCEGDYADKIQGIQIRKNSLIINRADYHHVHMYQCLAENSVGLSHVPITINIKYSPKITTHRRFVNTKDGSDAELHCNYKSTTPVSVYWMNRNRQIEHDEKKYKFYTETKSEHNTTILIVKNVNKLDIGDYHCMVRNAIGQNQLNISLIYEPEPPRFQATEANGENVTSLWHIRTMLPLTEVILHYQLDGTNHWIKETPIIPHTPSTEHSGIWEIKHLLTLKPGKWNTRVKASNSAGWSDYSDEHSFVVKSSFFDNEFEYHDPKDMTEATKEQSHVAVAAVGGRNGAIIPSSNFLFLLTLFLIVITITNQPANGRHH